MQGMQPQPQPIDPRDLPKSAKAEDISAWVEYNLGRKATEQDIEDLSRVSVMGNWIDNRRFEAERDVVDLYKNILGRSVDDKAREEYTKMYMQNPARVKAALYRSEEANQKTDQRFLSDAQKIAEEKGIALPDDFLEMAKQNNPYRNLAVGYEENNLMKYLEDSLPFKPTGMAGSVRTPETKTGGYYKLPLYVQQAGKATFQTEEEARDAAKQYSPEAVVNQYAKSPTDFYKDAAANAYADIWLLKATHPEEIADQLPAQVEEMQRLEDKYKNITGKATALGVTPEDISAYTGEKMKQVGSEYEKWYNDEHSDGFMNFLLLAGAVMLGAYGFAQLAGAGAGAAGTAGASSAAGTAASTAGYSWAGTGANLMAPGVYATGTGVGLPMFSGMTAAQAAAAMKAGTAGTTGGGNFITSTWDKIKNIPTKFSSGAPDGSSATEFLPGKVPTGKTQGLMDIIGVPENIQTGLDVAQKGSSLLNQLTGNNGQPAPTGGLQRQRVKRDVSTLIPNSVTMVDPNKWAEMTTLSRPGGLNMTRGV